MKPRVGQVLASTIDETAVIVVRWPDSDHRLTCGGADMTEPGDTSPTSSIADPDQMGGTLLGKRYADEDRGVELLCTKGGRGSLAIDGVVLAVKAARPLPASD